MSGPALLIDGRNVMYKSVFAGIAERNRSKNDNIQQHFFVIFLRQLTSWMNIKRPSSVHIFWDAPRETVWRKEVLATYKDRTSSTYVEGLKEHLATTTAVAMDFFEMMGVRQYSKKTMEADDLIYTAVSVMHPKPTIIVSSDSDFAQVPYRFHSCAVFNPSTSQDIDIPNVHPAYLKALVGDKADSIDGYDGIGPVKGAKLLSDPVLLQEFLAAKSPDLFHRNLLLIDLSLCPRLLANTVYVQRKMAYNLVWDNEAINSLMMKHRVNGLHQEYANLILPFKNLFDATKTHQLKDS